MDHITKALGRLLNAEPLATGMRGWRAVELWDEVVGESIARRSKAVRFMEGRLIVEVESSVWVQELSYLRTDILRRMNAALADGSNARPVKVIQLVLAGRSPRPAPGER